MGETIFNDIVKLMIMRGKSKADFYTYYIKFQHDKHIFYAMLGSVG